MLIKDIDKLPCGPEWEMKTKPLEGNTGKQTVEWYKRDTLDLVKMLLCSIKLSERMDWAPHKHYTSRDKTKRQYGDMKKSKVWWDVQVRSVLVLREGNN
jgi:hypothetical protein